MTGRRRAGGGRGGAVRGRGGALLARKHTSRLPVGAIRAALDATGLCLEHVDRLAYTWHVTPRRYLNMVRHHAPRVPVRHSLALAASGARVIRDLSDAQVQGFVFYVQAETLDLCLLSTTTRLSDALRVTTW